MKALCVWQGGHWMWVNTGWTGDVNSVRAAYQAMGYCTALVKREAA